MDLDKLNGFGPIINTFLKIYARFKSGQNWLKNNHLAMLIEIRDTLWYPL